MDTEAPKRGDRRGIRRRVLIAIIALPIVILLLGNLWLESPWGCGWLASKVRGRVGLETVIGGASFSPWNGVTIRRMEILQPVPLRMALKEPLVRAESIRLAPVWRSWLRGRPELQSIELDSPSVVVTVEMLVDIARPRAPAKPAAPPVAEATPQTPQTPQTPASPDSTAQPPKAPEPGPHAPQPAPVPLPPTGWLRLKNASFTVLSASSGTRWFQVSGVSGPLPVSGSHARSVLRLGGVEVRGRELLSNSDAVVDWQAPLLSLQPLETVMDGMKLTLAGKIGVASGIPLLVEAHVPKQKPPSIALPAEGHGEAETIAADIRFRGLLLAPGTWQGDCVAESHAISAHVAGHDLKFDHGSAVTVLRGGVLSCLDARLIGDDLSLLGNATVLADGRLGAALRMVAPPESAASIASRLFPSIPQPPSLTGLSTPQRAAFDMQAFGTIQRVFLKLGLDGPIVELNRPAQAAPLKQAIPTPDSRQ